MMYTENTNLIEYIEQIEAENALLKGFMASVIIEAHRDHYGDAAAAYSDIKEIIQEAEKMISGEAKPPKITNVSTSRPAQKLSEKAFKRR